MPVTHDLKILPEYFAAVMDGSKRAEFRRFDRDFKVGDLLWLHEYKDGEFTGASDSVLITHVLPIHHLCADAYAMLSFARWSETIDAWEHTL